jgi:hypothetical protein
MTRKVILAALLAALGGSLSACVAYEEPYGYGYRDYSYRDRPAYRDRDRDGIPNRRDRDRDGDRVPNRYDRSPDNPRVY